MLEFPRLPTIFFDRHVVRVAQDLLGKRLVVGNYSGIITETEAYRGYDDEASHAFKGPTARSKIMFRASGYSYVYLIYGMYNCLNVVAEEEGNPAAVSIRGLRLEDINLHLNGPGKLCKYLGITKEHNSIDLTTNEMFYLAEGTEQVKYLATPRIGITKARDRLWRFIID